MTGTMASIIFGDNNLIKDMKTVDFILGTIILDIKGIS